MICPNCGRKLAVSDRFCTNCGFKLELDEFSAQTQNDYVEENSNNNETDVIYDSADSLEENSESVKDNKKSFIWKEKYTYIFIGVAAALAVVGGMGIRTIRANQNNEEYSTAATINTEVDDNQDAEQLDIDIKSEAYETEVEEETPEYVSQLRNKYKNQLDEYLESENLDARSVKDGYVYYIYDQLVEVTHMESEWFISDYYYDSGEVYYAQIFDNGEENELFFQSGKLVYWIDGNNKNHSSSEATESWGYIIDDAVNMYSVYKDKTVAGFGEESEYIFPNSDREYIDKSDLDGLSEWEVRIARNEIMARHGRRFRDQTLQEYFNNCSWYAGTVDPVEFDENYEFNLNEYEKKNAATIKEYEEEHGYNQ